MSENSGNIRETGMEARIRRLAGVEHPAVRPERPFAESRVEFLAALGKELRRDPRISAYTDVAAFAFWCRKGNILRLRDSMADGKVRLGKGLVFHIAPSNVPVNFAYSYVLGLLSGNANIVRVSSKEFVQTDIICRAMERLFAQKEYEEIRDQTLIMSYEHDREVTDYYSARCDMRVIWGGDSTIETIRESKTGSRCGEIAFADRYSLGILRPSAVEEMDEEDLRQLAVNFYNDTYLMDQNACTAPHTLFWLTDSPGEKAAVASAKERFWKAVYEAAREYDLAEIKVSEKYARLCNFLADAGPVRGEENAQKGQSPFGRMPGEEDKAVPTGVKRYGNLLYAVSLGALPQAIDELRGSFGMFFEYEAENLDELAGHITKKVQTAAVCGVEREEVVDFICRNHLQGIDRITAFGQTLDMGIVWDGYDIIGTLSRTIG